MTSHTFHFIACVNDAVKMKECRHYISRLYLPEGWTTEITEITGAASMASGYNSAIGMKPGDPVRSDDVPIRIYLHQDVYILNRHLLQNLLLLFRSHPKAGLIGMYGTVTLHPSGVMWLGDYFGNVYDATDETYREELIDTTTPVTKVASVDGFLMATNRDVPWREDLFDGFDFYDVSQSRAFSDAGFEILVPEQQQPWCVHDNGRVPNLYNYNHYRKVFVKNMLQSASET